MIYFNFKKSNLETSVTLYRELGYSDECCKQK